MRLDEAGRLLDPTPLPLELGYERLDDGVLHVAVRTDMPDVSGEQFEWWFRSRPKTQQYIWWHPVDHVFSHWTAGAPGTHVGSTHIVTEEFTGLPAQNLLIQFRPNSEFFDETDFAEACSAGAVSAAVCGRTGMGWDAARGPGDLVLGGRLLHIGRNTQWGMTLRSHFFLGQDLPALGMESADVEAEVPDEFGIALLQHCYNEFTFLSRFLPSVYIGENRDRERPVLPW